MRKAISAMVTDLMPPEPAAVSGASGRAWVRPDPMVRDHGSALVRARAGDSEAFGEFYDAQFDQLLAWFRARTACGEVAADLCSETFAKSLALLHRYDPELGSEGAWLFGIAKNELRHWHRHRRVAATARRRLGVISPSVDADDLDLADLRADLEQTLGPLENALGRLTPATRHVLIMRVVEGRSYSEITAEVGGSEGAARVRVSRALSTLLDDLEGGGER